MKTEFDVIVVGGGGSGLAAAVSAAEHGCSVVVLEKQAQLGGTTGIAVGSFTANGTRLQRKAGIEDDPAAHEEDAGRFAPEAIEHQNNAALRHYFLSHTAATLEWLEGMGLSFYGPSPEPPNRVARMHNVVPAAKAYIATLQARLLRLGGRILCRAGVRELVMEERGWVTGVKAAIQGRERVFRALRGVVLAAGDYAGATDLIRAHKGEQYAAVEGINPHAKGDGHRLARQAGGQLLNMDITYGPEIRFVAPPGRTFDQLLPAGGMGAKAMGFLLPLTPKFVLNRLIKRLLVTWQHPENALFDDGAILVNREGKRFCNETVSPQRELAIAAQPDKEAYILLDERLRERYSAWPHFISTAPEIAYAYVKDYLKLRPDITTKSRSLTALAGLRGMLPQHLHDTVKEFNAYAKGETRDAYGRKGDRHLLGGDFWVLLGPAKAWFTTTEGGTAINEYLQVLNEAGEPIPGLFAVGQNGLGGQVLWGHGLHIAWALTSGRLAGQVLGEMGGSKPTSGLRGQS